MGLDAEPDGLMTNPTWSFKLIIGKELLPSLGDQVKQVRPIYGDLTVEHDELKITPHDM